MELIRFVLSNKIPVSILSTLVYCSFILPLNESLWFDNYITDPTALMYSRFIKLAFGVTFFFVLHFTLSFIAKLIDKDPFYMSWLKNSTFYGGIMLVVFFLIYPGYWSWDDFWVLESSHTYTPYPWQHIFTQIQYIFSLYVIPSSTGITIIQLGIITTIVGYAITYMKRSLISKRKSFLLWVPFFTLPVIFSNFYTLRLHLYGYLLLLLLLKVHQIFTSHDRAAIHRPYVYFLGISILVTLLAFWRSEGIFLLAILPVFFVKLGLLDSIKKRTSLLRVMSTLGCSIIFISMGLMAANFADSPRYKVSATISPLSMLVQNENTDSDDWRNINKVIDINLLKQQPSYTDIKSFWNANFLRKDYEQHMQNYYGSLANIIVKRPDDFLKIKLKTFLSTNSLYPIADGETIVRGTGLLTDYSTTGCKNIGGRVCNMLHRFDKMSKANMPFAPEIRKIILNFLILELPSLSFSTALKAIFWNVVPILALVVGVFFHSLRASRKYWSVILSIPILLSVLVFLTAPASFFMYYFPIYLAGFTLSIFYILLEIDRRKSNEAV